MILLSVLALGCATTPPEHYHAAAAHPEKSEAAYPDAVKKAHKPHKGLKLSSMLYDLAVSPDPVTFAEEHDIFINEGKVRVFINFDPESSLSERNRLAEAYRFRVEKKSGDLSRALVPVDQLIPLSTESAIWSLMLPGKAKLKGRESYE